MTLLQESPAPLFDYIYLDGAHTWAIDALAFFVADLLLKPGGYIDFDDYSWTIDGSPTVNPRVYPRIREMYTDEQMQTRQVASIVELLVRRPERDERDRVDRRMLVDRFGRLAEYPDTRRVDHESLRRRRCASRAKPASRGSRR